MTAFANQLTISGAGTTVATTLSTYGSNWDDQTIFINGSIGISSGRGKDRKPRKPRVPTRRPDPFLPNIFITNRKTGRTKTYHSSLEATAFLWGKDLAGFIIIKDIPLGAPDNRLAFTVVPTTNDLHDLQIQLDSIT